VTSFGESIARPATRRRDLALAVAAAAESVPGIRMTAGHSRIEISTLYPGGRVAGVSLGEKAVIVSVVASRLPIPAVAEEVAVAVRAALEERDDRRPVEVVVDDIDLDQLPPPPTVHA